MRVYEQVILSSDFLDNKDELILSNIIRRFGHDKRAKLAIHLDYIVLLRNSTQAIALISHNHCIVVCKVTHNSIIVNW